MSDPTRTNDDDQNGVVVFAYDFPHRKTQEFLLRLFLERRNVSAVLAAPRVELDISPSSVRTKVRHSGLVHPRDVAERFGFPYHRVAHSGEEIEAILDRLSPDIGLVAGARILGPPIVERFGVGIINLHPGRLPEIRGLDALFWSIEKDVPLAITSHLIDERVDAGSMLERRLLHAERDDTAFDLSERLFEGQLEMLGSAIDLAAAGAAVPLEVTHGYNRKMEPEQEQRAMAKLGAYLARHYGGED